MFPVSQVCNMWGNLSNRVTRPYLCVKAVYCLICKLFNRGRRGLWNIKKKRDGSNFRPDIRYPAGYPYFYIRPYIEFIIRANLIPGLFDIYGLIFLSVSGLAPRQDIRPWYPHKIFWNIWVYKWCVGHELAYSMDQLNTNLQHTLNIVYAPGGILCQKYF